MAEFLLHGGFSGKAALILLHWNKYRVKRATDWPIQVSGKSFPGRNRQCKGP